MVLSSVTHILFLVRDVKLRPNPDEVAGVRYVSREQLEELVRKADAGEDGVKLSPWFRLMADNLLMGWRDHLEKGTLSEAADMQTIQSQGVSEGPPAAAAWLRRTTTLPSLWRVFALILLLPRNVGLAAVVMLRMASK